MEDREASGAECSGGRALSGLLPQDGRDTSSYAKGQGGDVHGDCKCSTVVGVGDLGEGVRV